MPLKCIAPARPAIPDFTNAVVAIELSLLLAAGVTEVGID
jgi:hypothetical protein